MKQKNINKMRIISEKCVIIDKKKLSHNYNEIKKRIGISKIIPVIKGDAYGHGITECFKTLYRCGSRDFYVARLEDAIKLKKQNLKNINVFLLSGTTSKETCDQLSKYQIIQSSIILVN
jgi:alanine racemase